MEEYVVKLTLVVQLNCIEGAEYEVKLTLVVQLDCIEGAEYVVKLTLVVQLDCYNIVVQPVLVNFVFFPFYRI
jgi:hypothetical protein